MYLFARKSECGTTPVATLGSGVLLSGRGERALSRVNLSALWCSRCGSLNWCGTTGPVSLPSLHCEAYEPCHVDPSPSCEHLASGRIYRLPWLKVTQGPRR
jgi:hypothetical protein